MLTKSVVVVGGERTPKVSVVVVTYNQEKYIQQCLQSIIDQVTNFDFEVIVADDCSTDGTKDIIKKFAGRFKNIVKPFFHEKNIGPYKNFVFAHKQAKGEYIAHIDGDDYCLPDKLQTQSNFLDRHKNCNIVWHRMLLENAMGVLYDGPLGSLKNIDQVEFDRGSIIEHISIGFHSSKMYRKSVRDYEVPNFGVTDYFANVMQVGDGVARYCGTKPFGVYRLGIGIANNGLGTRVALAKSFEYFYKKHPDYRLEANTAALMYMISDLKNRRKSWLMFLKVWVKTLNIKSPFRLYKNMTFLKDLKIKLDEI